MVGGIKITWERGGVQVDALIYESSKLVVRELRML